MTDTPDPIEAHPEIDYPVKVDDPPAISTFLSGITYAISGETWIPIPGDSTREDLTKWMVWDDVGSLFDEVKVVGSRGDTYIIRRSKETGNVTCSCPGFKWRGKCKHLPLCFPP